MTSAGQTAPNRLSPRTLPGNPAPVKPPLPTKPPARVLPFRKVEPAEVVEVQTWFRRLTGKIKWQWATRFFEEILTEAPKFGARFISKACLPVSIGLEIYFEREEIKADWQDFVDQASNMMYFANSPREAIIYLNATHMSPDEATDPANPKRQEIFTQEENKPKKEKDPHITTSVEGQQPVQKEDAAANQVSDSDVSPSTDNVATEKPPPDKKKKRGKKRKKMPAPLIEELRLLLAYRELPSASRKIVEEIIRELSINLDEHGDRLGIIANEVIRKHEIINLSEVEKRQIKEIAIDLYYRGIMAIEDPLKERPYLKMGLIIRDAREALDLTPKKAAKKIGVPINRLSSWEYGKRGVPLEMISNVAKKLQINEKTLLDATKNTRRRRTGKEVERPYKKIGDKLRARRREIGLTPNEAAGKIGISSARLSCIENGTYLLQAGKISDTAETLGLDEQQLRTEVLRHRKMRAPEDVLRPFEKVGNLLRTTREQMGLSREDVCKEVPSFDTERLRMVEIGIQNLKEEYVEPIAEVLKIDVTSLRKIVRDHYRRSYKTAADGMFKEEAGRPAPTSSLSRKNFERGREITKALDRKHMSQKKFSAKTKIPEEVLSKAIRGMQPLPKKYHPAVKKILGIDLNR